MRIKPLSVTTILLAALLCWPYWVLPQEKKEVKVFSLKDAQEYARKNAYAVKSSDIDLASAKQKIWETIAMGLPQVNGSVKYQDMLDIPVQLIPDFLSPVVVSVNQNLFGLKPTHEVSGGSGSIPVQFGTQHNLSLGGTISQLLFSGQYIVGLQATRVYYALTKQTKEKSDIDVRFNVSQSYFMILSTEETRKILKEQQSALEKMVYETEEGQKNGFVEDIVTDQMKLNLLTLNNALNTVDRMVSVSYKLLKLQMGINDNDSIMLKDSLNGLLVQQKLDPILNNEFNISNHIDYRLMETQMAVALLNLRREQSAALPTLAGYYTLSTSAQRNQFDFTNKSGVWFPTSIIGVSMDVPIFSSFMRSSRVQQARLSIEKTKIAKEQAEQGLKLGAFQARQDYNSALDQYQKNKQNRELASHIYQKTSKKYKEGMVSSSELTQVYNQYLSAQTTYFSSIFELLNTRNKYDKALNNF